MNPTFESLSCNVKNDYEWDEDKPIGFGGNGMVYKGVRRRDNLQVAIKIFNEHRLAHYFEEKKHFIREINLLFSIDHPFCLGLINYCFDPFAIITPFMEQGSLADFLNPKSKKYGKLSPTQKMCTVYSICSTMDAIHSAGYMHRDLKPDNVFMKQNDKYFDSYIADFGSARLVGQNADLTEGASGTPYHQSPESFFSNNYTNATDVYSFGVIFLQYFRYGFQYADGQKLKTTAYAIVDAVRKGAFYKKPENMTDEQYNIYLQCSNLNDSERPSFQDLANTFEKYELIWFKGVNKDEYLEYVQRCKNICQEYKNAHQKTPGLQQISLNLSPKMLKSKNLSRSASISPSSSTSFRSQSASTSPFSSTSLRSSHKDYLET